MIASGKATDHASCDRAGVIARLSGCRRCDSRNGDPATAASEVKVFVMARPHN